MTPTIPIGSPSSKRLLTKGPEHLRRQMENGSRSQTPSAVERLEADKAKYVKSEQVMKTRQEPVLNPCATPLLKTRKLITVHQSNVLHDSATKEDGNHLEELRNLPNVPTQQSAVIKQKRDCRAMNTHENSRGYNFVRRLFQGSLKGKPTAPHNVSNVVIKESKEASKRDDPEMSRVSDNEELAYRLQSPMFIPVGSSPSPFWARRSLKLPRSRSEPNSPVFARPGLQGSDRIRSRCSLALSDRERFFNYCGLDLDMVECLGIENSSYPSSDTLSLMFRSTSATLSEGSRFSQCSKDDSGLPEELNEQLSSVVSVVERNARVIKWLYSCKAARQTPKQSTV
uniref:Family with sequence similarity 110 member D n=1 Tax=Latimeria chalumnae TaxID=7897 RepID=H3B9Z6_LATCH